MVEAGYFQPLVGQLGLGKMPAACAASVKKRQHQGSALQLCRDEARILARQKRGDLGQRGVDIYRACGAGVRHYQSKAGEGARSAHLRDTHALARQNPLSTCHARRAGLPSVTTMTAGPPSTPWRCAPCNIGPNCSRRGCQASARDGAFPLCTLAVAWKRAAVVACLRRHAVLLRLMDVYGVGA